LEPRLGKTVRSLALLNGRPAASYFLLRRALDAGAEPKLVLVDYQPECMFEETDHLLSNTQWKALLSLWECWDLSLSYGDASFFARTAVARLIPSVRCSPGIRQSVLTAIKDVPNPGPGVNARFLRNREVNHGGMILARKPDYRGDVTPKILRGSVNTGWLARQEHATYIDRFLDLANRRHIPVVWLLPPNVPTIDRGRERLGVSRRFDAFIRGFQARFPNLIVIDGRSLAFDHSLFVDPVHLDRRGATALTMELADVLRIVLEERPSAREGLGRWVALSSDRRAEERVALEDLDQSEAAIQAARVRR
jgi:hypothetical protein